VPSPCQNGTDARSARKETTTTTPTIAARRTISCPSWCVDHAGHNEDGDSGRLHHGPRFGLVETWANESGRTAGARVRLRRRSSLTRPA
jgi:hypothetical protein